MSPVLLLVASYLLGAVPTSYIVGRLARGIDLREHGSCNLGATNAFRVLGWRLALPILIVDILKGWGPTFLFPLWDASPPGWALAYGGMAVIGHVFSVFVRFRGGKGVATGAGVFLALAPAAALASFVVWAVTVYLTRIVSLASLLGALTLPITVWVVEGDTPVLRVAVALAVFVYYSHRANIRRLVRGEEPKISRPREVG